MAGVPHHAASAYIQRLLEQGFKVAICEQMADPSKVKGIVPREVVRVVTPGIVVRRRGARRAGEPLPRRRRAATGAARGGFAALDASTGELSACEAAASEAAVAELVRLDAREVLVGPEARSARGGARGRAPAGGRARGGGEPDRRARGRQDPRRAARAGRGAASARRGRAARGRAVRRDGARVRAGAGRCRSRGSRPTSCRDTLLLDEATQRHLELVRSVDGEARGSLLAQIDETKTAPGARLLRRRLLAPLTRVAEIRRRLDAVELFVTQPGLRAEVRAKLSRRGGRRAPRRQAHGRPRDARATRGAAPLARRAPGARERARARAPIRARATRSASREGAPFVDELRDLHDLLARAVRRRPPAARERRQRHPRRLRRARSTSRASSRATVSG